MKVDETKKKKSKKSKQDRKKVSYNHCPCISPAVLRCLYSK